jgi:hypothetical protein
LALFFNKSLARITFYGAGGLLVPSLLVGSEDEKMLRFLQSEFHQLVCKFNVFMCSSTHLRNYLQSSARLESDSRGAAEDSRRDLVASWD